MYGCARVYIDMVEVASSNMAGPTNNLKVVVLPKKKRFHGVNRTAKKSAAPRKSYRMKTMTTLANIINVMTANTGR